VPPVDLTLPTALLYPGQVRGGDYKAHGGFRFDRNGQTNTVNVVASMDAAVTRGVRYIETGEIQYMFDFINPCGIAYRLDHLLELSAKFSAIAATLPPATASTTTAEVFGQTVTAGETIGTAVGFRSPPNVTLDWGVYDLRQRNPAVSRPGELAPYGLCWLDHMSPSNNALARALPPSGQSGATSDYCR
jgi:hypothetical protein